MLTPGFPENEQDNNCIPALQVYARSLVQSGKVNLTVITFQYPFIARKYSWEGISVVATGGKNSKGIQKYLNWKRVIKRAKEIHNHRSVDHVHSFWLGECAYVGQIVCRFTGAIHTCTLMGQDALLKNKYPAKIKRMPDLVTLSKFHHRTLLNNFGLKSKYIIPWGVEEVVSSGPKKKEIDVIGIGNLTQLKSFDRFVKVISELKAMIPDIRTEIIGDGPEMPLLKKQIADMGLEDSICLCGELKREQVLEKLLESKCLLHLSRYESFGMVFIEAQQNGVKVFATETGIASELENATLVKSDDEAVTRIAAFLKQPPIENVIFRFNVSNTVRSYLEKVYLA